MANFADRLADAIDGKQSAVMVGLDPRVDQFPAALRESAFAKHGDTPAGRAAAILEFNKAVIDVAAPIVPVVKPQIAFYEQLGWEGYRAYIETIRYAHEQGLLVVADVKRGDIGSTASAYADAHLSVAEADAVTVNPYLGWDSVRPFVEAAHERGSGLFVLVKTSNESSADFQDIDAGGRPLYEVVAERVAEWGRDLVGTRGLSAIGAVVGATFPAEAERLRSIMPDTPFLVPGYGAQGGTAADVLPCFRSDGAGAVVNSSRGIIFAYEREPWATQFGEARWQEAVEAAIKQMTADIAGALAAR